MATDWDRHIDTYHLKPAEGFILLANATSLLVFSSYTETDKNVFPTRLAKERSEQTKPQSDQSASSMPFTRRTGEGLGGRQLTPPWLTHTHTHTKKKWNPKQEKLKVSGELENNKGKKLLGSFVKVSLGQPQKPQSGELRTNRKWQVPTFARSFKNFTLLAGLAETPSVTDSSLRSAATRRRAVSPIRFQTQLSIDNQWLDLRIRRKETWRRVRPSVATVAALRETHFSGPFDRAAVPTEITQSCPIFFSALSLASLGLAASWHGDSCPTRQSSDVADVATGQGASTTACSEPRAWACDGSMIMIHRPARSTLRCAGTRGMSLLQANMT